jgi:hypothetical protein
MADAGKADAAAGTGGSADERREKSCIEISEVAGRGDFGSNPYAGANRFRFKGFPRCHPAQRFLSPLTGISLGTI